MFPESTMRTAMLVLMTALTSACAGLPPLGNRSASTAFTDTADTRLGRGQAAEAAANPGRSGMYPLPNPLDAFVARGLLAQAAERSLDVQYYIWHGDTTGYLLFEALWQAAGRGVRVRLLLDDNGIHGLDETIAALDSHSNIEVRLFNPFKNRTFRSLGYLTDFDRLNRRMHNKSFTADTQATIVGGRNVGDEYFGAGDAMVFADLDVLGVGRVALDVAHAFDLYWNSDSAYPAQSIVGGASSEAVSRLETRFASVRAAPEATEYLKALRDTRLVEQLLARELPLEWVPMRLVYDEPVKALGHANAEDLLLTRLGEALGTADHAMDIVSPYFVPGKKGTKTFSAYPERGVGLRILTNSLAATDVGAVHAGYAKYREPLLRAGARIYELKPDADASHRAARKGKEPAGSSGASLHAKTFAIDRSRVFIGSFNLDPRSVNLNTEMGVVIDSPTLARAISDGLDRALPQAAWEVTLGRNGRGLEWIDRGGAAEVRYETEPKTGFLRRLGVGFLSILPIEWLL